MSGPSLNEYFRNMFYDTLLEQDRNLYSIPTPVAFTTVTTTTKRVKPFYHPSSYSKRWKRR